MQASDLLEQLNEEMLQAARSLEFEKAAAIRDQIQSLKAHPALAGAGEAKIRRSELEAGLSKKPIKPKPGMPGTKVAKRGKKSRG
jgi:hypothetical protein